MGAVPFLPASQHQNTAGTTSMISTRQSITSSQTAAESLPKRGQTKKSNPPQQEEQLPLFGAIITPQPTPIARPPAQRPFNPPDEGSHRAKLVCADCREELTPAVSGKLWHTETETKLPSRGKTYLVPCPVTGSKDHGYADKPGRN